MATTKPKNLAESVRQKLVNLARARAEEPQAVLTRYGVERFLYRLTRTPGGDRFVLGLTTAFAEDPGKQTQWRAYLKRKGLRPIPSDFTIVVRRVAALLQPVLESARDGSASPRRRWVAGRGWTGA
jgi:hypothetical protein